MIISENDGCWDVGIKTLLGTNISTYPIQDGSWEDDFPTFHRWDMDSFPGVKSKRFCGENQRRSKG